MVIARSGISWIVSKFGALGVTFLGTMYFTRALSNPTKTLGEFQLFETALSLLLLLTNAGVGSALVKRMSEGKTKIRTLVPHS